MADNLNDDEVSTLREVLRSWREVTEDDILSRRDGLRRQNEVAENDILAREGYVRNMHGGIDKLDSASKRRIDLENKINKEIEEVLGKELALSRKQLRSQERQQEAFEKQVEDMGYLIKSNGDFVKTSVELTKQQKKKLAELKIDDIGKGKAVSELAEKLNSTKAITGEFSSKILEATKNSVGLTVAYKAGSAVFEGLISSATVMTKALYEGERGAMVSAKAVSAFGDSITTAMKGIGAALLLLPGFKLLAIGIMALTTLIDGLTELNKLAAEQNDKLFKSFNKLSEAGLAGAEGMTGVFKTVQTLGMTVEQLEKFNELLVSNSKDLKLFGTTAYAGAEQFAKVAGGMYKSKDVGQQLEMLGVTADQQREHTLKYMAQQTRMGMLQKGSTDNLIKSAGAYIEELDKISMLTGATRKEQEEARAAVMAEEELRAAMLQAEIDGDTDRQKQLKAMADYSAYLRVAGDTRGATGVAKYAAAGGPVDEASAAAMITYGKGIEAALNGKPIAEIIKQGNDSSKDILKQMAGSKSVGADVSGLVTGKFGTLVDNTKMIDEAVKLSEKTGKTFDQALKDLQEERKNGDQTTKINVEAGRLQQSSAQMIDSAVQKFNYSAELNVIASQLMQKAINALTKFAGAPVTGGDIQVNRSGAPIGAPAGAPTPTPSPVPGGNTGPGGSAAIPPGMTPGQRPFTGRPIDPATPPAAPATPPAGPVVPARPPAPATPATPPAAPVPAPAAPVPAPTGPVVPARPPISGTPVIGPPAAPVPAPATPIIPPTGPVPAPTGPVVPASPPAKPPAKPSTGQLVNFNSGSGDKAHFDKLNSGVRNAFIQMIGEYGKPVQVTSSFRSTEQQQKLWDEGTPTEKPNIRMRKGIPVAMPGTSSHETGNALDINENVVNSLKTTASSTGDNLLKTYGFKTVSGDPIHIQKAEFGGSFDGPQSGYPVLLHGPEVVVPKPEFQALQETLASVTKNSLSSVMPTAEARAGGTDSITALKSLHGIMSDKFDQMITVMERSADIQARLLNNSMV